MFKHLIRNASSVCTCDTLFFLSLVSSPPVWQVPPDASQLALSRSCPKHLMGWGDGQAHWLPASWMLSEVAATDWLPASWMLSEVAATDWLSASSSKLDAQ